MKIGIEVEGMYKGLKTLFCSAEEVEHAQVAAVEHGVPHVYVSNLDQFATANWLAHQFPDLMVTVEQPYVSVVTVDARPPNLRLMLNMSPGSAGYASVSRLQAGDQLKYCDGLNVIVFPASAAIHTEPKDFAGDIEL